MDSNSVHPIGMTELYTEIRSLGDKFSDYMNRHDVEASIHTLQITDLRNDLLSLESKFEAEQLRRTLASKQAFWAIFTSFVLPIAVAGVLLYVTSK